MDFPGSGGRALTLGGGDFREGRDLTRSARGGLYAVPPVPGLPVITPAVAPKEVGDVKLTDGARGEAVKYDLLSGYVADTDFGVQPVRIRFLGVREASQEAALGALREMAYRP